MGVLENVLVALIYAVAFGGMLLLHVLHGSR